MQMLIGRMICRGMQSAARLQCSIHLGVGFLELVYENALVYELALGDSR
jgi:hypothetical protein